MINDGKSTSLWFDIWVGDVALVDRLQISEGQPFPMGKNALVADIIERGRWELSRLPCDDELKKEILDVPTNFNIADQPQWRANRSMQFSLKLAIDSIRSRGNVDAWKKALWFKHHIPRYSFVSWLAILNRLPTADRLTEWGLNVSGRCLFCDQLESRDHLFLECNFSRTIWEEGLRLSCTHCPCHGWSNIKEWIFQICGISSFRYLVIKLLWTAVIYRTWQQRNVKLHGGKWRSSHEVFQVIRRDIIFKCSSLSDVGLTSINMDVCCNWNIPTNIL